LFRILEERWFRQPKRHERRIHGRRHAGVRLVYAVAITFFYHNFVRIHQTLRMTPALKAGIADYKWSIEEMVDLLPESTHPNRRGNSN
jgi:hypothetical protein